MIIRNLFTGERFNSVVQKFEPGYNIIACNANLFFNNPKKCRVGTKSWFP